jgi:uncharacterized membrane protein YphA (DoxX/SURF4 family)
MFYRLIGTPDDRTIAMLRLVSGSVFFAHGAQKMLGWFEGPDFSGTMQSVLTVVFAISIYLLSRTPRDQTSCAEQAIRFPN